MQNGIENVQPLAYPEIKPLRFNRAGRDGKDHNKSGNNQSSSYKGCQCNTATAGREFAPNDPILALKIAVESNQ